MNEDQGFGHPRLADGAGASPVRSILTAGGGRPRGRAGRAESPAPAPACAARRWTSARRLREHGVYRTPYRIDPFAVPLEDKLALLSAADEAMRRVPGHDGRHGRRSTRSAPARLFASSEGSDIEQEIDRDRLRHRGDRRGPKATCRPAPTPTPSAASGRTRATNWSSRSTCPATPSASPRKPRPC